MTRILAAGWLVALSAASGFAAEPLPIGMVNVDRILRTHKPLLEKLEPLRATSRSWTRPCRCGRWRLKGWRRS